jgi:RNA polymerase sigma factor (sigma-70 family)
MSGARPIDRHYVKVVAQQDFLSPEDEARIVEVLRRRAKAERQYARGAIGVEEVRVARTRAVEAEARLIAAHLRLVVHIVKRFERDGVDLDDLVGVGNKALVMAARLYPARGRGRFAAYAKGWVRGAVANVADQSSYVVKVPERLARTVRRYQGLLSAQVSNRGGLDRATLSDLLDVDEGVLAEVERVSLPTVSLSAPVGDGTLTLGDLLFYVDQELLEREETERRLLPEEIDRLLAAVDKREKEILELRFGIDRSSAGEPRSYEEVGEHFNLTRERIRQIEERARAKVRDAASDAGAPELPQLLIARRYSRTAADIAVGAAD